MRRINFIISTGHRNWVLHHLATTLSIYFKGSNCKIVEFPQTRKHLRKIEGYLWLKKAKNNFYLHQDLALAGFQKGWFKKAQRNFVNYTHDNKELKQYLEVFKLTNFIIVQNSSTKQSLLNYEIPIDKILVLPNPIDFEKFKFSNLNKERDIIFVSNFYYRKQPDLILSVIKSNPNLTFTIYGKGWESYSRFNELRACKNLIYSQFEYENYSNVLARHKIFCSLSSVEGGPVPLLESLSVGLIPIATDTGTARDIIPFRYHDLIIPIDSTYVDVNMAIKKAMSFEPVRLELDDKYSYEGFCKEIEKIIL